MEWHRYNIHEPNTLPKDNGKYYIVALNYNLGSANIKRTTVVWFDGCFRNVEDEGCFEGEKYITHWTELPEYPLIKN